MDGYIYRISVQVLYLYHLLITVTLRHPHQAPKATDAVVNVYHIIAHLKLLYLLERKGHLATPCAVRTEIVFMEAVEYLVVSKEAHLQAIVGESLVESMVYRCECDA